MDPTNTPNFTIDLDVLIAAAHTAAAAAAKPNVTVRREERGGTWVAVEPARCERGSLLVTETNRADGDWELLVAARDAAGFTCETLGITEDEEGKLWGTVLDTSL